MPNPADEVYNDGSIPHGSAVLTNARNGLTYDCDDFTLPKVNTKVVKRVKATGAKGGSFGLKDFLEGSTTVQIPTVDADGFAEGDTFTADKSGAKVWIVTKVDEANPKENYQTQSISFIEKLN